MKTFRQAAESNGLQFSWQRHDLKFNFEARTSRGSIHSKPSWYLRFDRSKGQTPVFGEVNIINGLSPESEAGFEAVLQKLQADLKRGIWPDDLFWRINPSLRFAFEMAELNAAQNTPFLLFPSDFTTGIAHIPINGLVWMDNIQNMRQQALAKIDAGFDCVKLKVGAEDFEQELSLLRELRRAYPADILTIRIDANGAFAPEDALEKLKRLSQLQIHSIEQPIRVGLFDEMAALCESSPLPVALDEELIAPRSDAEKIKMLDMIKPQYLILKPSLIGGLTAADEWIRWAEERNIGWWATSALESNIGLNAISQWVFTKKSSMHQGLGTGLLYSNNFESPLVVERGVLRSELSKKWNIDLLHRNTWN